MLCEICGKEEGSIKYTKIINGEKVEFYICEKCAKKKGFYSLLSHSGEDTMLSEEQVIKEAVCPSCGWKLKDIEEKSKLGCPQCYNVFRPYIRDLLTKLHDEKKHIGKVPLLDKEKLEIRRKIREVKKALDDAIKKEQYELAAELRDKIKNLSLKMVKDGKER